MRTEININSEDFIEWMRKDPKFYLENFCKIKTKEHGLQPFILKAHQLDIFNAVAVNPRVMIVKGRQMGCSTAMVGFFYHNTIFNPGYNTALIGYNSSIAKEFMEKVKTFYRTTPNKMKPKIEYNTKDEITFKNTESKMFLLSSADNVGRGWCLHRALISELPYWQNAEEKMQSLESSVPSNGKMVVESTPTDVQTLFYRMWINQDNGYVKREYGWWWEYSPEQIEFIRKRVSDPIKFAQDYECMFTSTGRSVFPMDLIRKHRKNQWIVGDIVPIDMLGTTHIVFERKDGLRIYKPPTRDGIYVMGVDVAEGLHDGDYSVVVILDRKTNEEVAMYRGHTPPDQLGVLCVEWGKMYNTALSVVEANGHGLTTITIMKQLLYPSMYTRPSKFESFGQGISDKLGWRTTQMTRPLMLDDFRKLFRDGDVLLHSRELFDECSTFIFDDTNTMRAEKGSHDDMIMATAICIQGFKNVWSAPLQQLNYEGILPMNYSY